MYWGSHVFHAMWLTEHPWVNCGSQYMTKKIMLLNVRVLKDLAILKCFWTCHDQNLIQNQTYNVSEMFLQPSSMLQPESLLASWCCAHAVCTGVLSATTPQRHNASDHCPEYLSSESRLQCAMNGRDFTACRELSAVTETQWFNYKDQRLLITSYGHSLARRDEINISLDSIVLECLVLNIIIWITDLSFMKNFHLILAWD